MKRESMKVPEALGILGIQSQSPTSDEIKKAYYAAVKVAHPDVGGTEEKMKLVNLAFELLSEVRFDVKRDSEAFLNRSLEIANALCEQLKKGWGEDAFTEHLAATFDKEFTCESLIEVKKGFTTYNTVLLALFISKDGETTVKFRGWVQVLNIMVDQGESVGAGPNESGVSEFPMSIDIEISHENKKVKPYQKNYLFKNSHFFLSPEDLLPRERLQKAITSSKKRKFSRQDMLTTLRNKYEATFDGDYLYAPIGSDHRIVFYRSVFNRTPVWGCNGFYQTKPHKKLVQGVMTLPETEETLAHISQAIERIREAHESEIEEVARRELKLLETISRGSR